MEKVLVFGHKNPDTDTICSAITYAYLKEQLGMNAEAVRLGNISSETQYALDTFKVEAPRLVNTVSNEVDKVILVDHNEAKQSVDDRDQVQIIEVIDHHRINGFATEEPLYMRVEPIGCTATIVYKLFKENNIEIPRNMAGLLLSAIISDTLLFKSPTCTPQDTQAAQELNKIVDVDLSAYGMDLLKAGTKTDGMSIDELLNVDAKEFGIGSCKVEVSQLNTVDISEVLAKQEALESRMNEVIAEKGLDLFMFVITDIVETDSKAIVLGPKADLVDKAFNTSVENNVIFLKDVVSRKKQIVPVITEALS